VGIVPQEFEGKVFCSVCKSYLCDTEDPEFHRKGDRVYCDRCGGYVYPKPVFYVPEFFVLDLDNGGPPVLAEPPQAEVACPECKNRERFRGYLAVRTEIVRTGEAWVCRWGELVEFYAICPVCGIRLDGEANLGLCEEMEFEF
jgi:hypothetical protein